MELDCTVGRDADPGNLTPPRRADIRKIAGDLGLWLTAVQGVATPSASDTAHAANLERFKVMAWTRGSLPALSGFALQDLRHSL